MNKKLYLLASIILSCYAIVSCSVEEMEEPFSLFDLNLSPEFTQMSDGMATKADLIHDTTTITDKSLKLYGYENDTYWIQGKPVKFSNNKWGLTENYNFRINSKSSYEFLAYANKPTEGCSLTGADASNRRIYIKVTDITKAQEDILLGHTEIASPKSGDVPIAFSHPYASVKFILGNAVSVTSIKEISITGIYGIGSTSLKKSNTQDANGVTQYSWKVDYGNPNYTITASNLTNISEGGEIATFLVIPQKLSSKKAIVTITYGDDNSTMAKVLNEGSWVAGYTTTYTVDNIDSIEISISESNTIKNTGNSKAWVRATITGAWYDTSGNIVAPWNPSEGNFTNLPGSKWEKSEEYYYYTEALSKNASPSSLFTGYTKPSAPIDGATLKLDVLVQAIPYKVNKSCKESFSALN